MKKTNQACLIKIHRIDKKVRGVLRDWWWAGAEKGWVISFSALAKGEGGGGGGCVIFNKPSGVGHPIL